MVSHTTLLGTIGPWLRVLDGLREGLPGGWRLRGGCGVLRVTWLFLRFGDFRSPALFVEFELAQAMGHGLAGSCTKRNSQLRYVSEPEAPNQA